MSTQGATFDPLKKAFVILNIIISLAILGGFIPAFLLTEDGDDDQSYLDAATYTVASILIIAVVFFLVYGTMLYLKLSKLARKTSQTKRKQKRLSLKVFLVALGFSCFLLVSAIMWILSASAVDYYLDNFTMFNSIFLGAEVCCLLLTLYMYAANIHAARTKSRISSNSRATTRQKSDGRVHSRQASRRMQSKSHLIEMNEMSNVNLLRTNSATSAADSTAPDLENDTAAVEMEPKEDVENKFTILSENPTPQEDLEGNDVQNV